VSIRPCPMCGSTHPFFVAVWPPLWTSVCSVYLKLLPQSHGHSFINELPNWGTLTEGSQRALQVLDVA
jgi:hypothetical protein